MTWVKVCGLTRAVDVATAESAGADAIGFVVIPSSPRAITPDAVAELATRSGITTVLLVADVEVPEALDLIERTGVDGVQPYGEGAVDIAAAAMAHGKLALMPFQVSGPIAEIVVPAGAIPLLDTPGKQLGGSGHSFDWSHVAGVSANFILAGGLGPDNVEDAIRSVRPWGVDASSRLEQEPGIKDPSKVTAFIRKAKTT